MLRGHGVSQGLVAWAAPVPPACHFSRHMTPSIWAARTGAAPQERRPSMNEQATIQTAGSVPPTTFSTSEWSTLRVLCVHYHQHLCSTREIAYGPGLALRGEPA